MTTPTGERLAKVIARSGLCSRRDAEEWIRAGRVAVNGTVIRTPAFNVTDKDKIKVDGAPLAARTGTRLWLYHKPPGLVVTEKDPEGRATIFEALEEAGLPRVLTIGRLDLNTEGLLLLTNDGGLKRVLELPATGWLRRYRVRAFGAITQAQLDGLKQGIEVEGVKYGPIEAQLEREQGSNVWLLVSLREGKNREVKNVLSALGLVVNRLIRVSYGPFQLGDLPVGGIEVVKARVLREQLGKKLADEAGVDFESEMPEPAAARRASRPPARGERGAPPDRSRPARRDGRFAPDAHPAGPRPRRVLFDDGRPPEEFVPAEPRGPKREFGKREGTARGDRPARSAERPPRGGDRAGRTDRPARTSERPPRRDNRPGRDAARPSGAARPDRKPYVKRDPARSPAGPERSARPDKRGPRPAGGGPRPAGSGPRAASSGPRPTRGGPRPAGGPRPSGGPRSGTRPAGPKPGGSRPGGGKPPRKPRS